MRIVLCFVLALVVPRLAHARDCATPPNLRSQVYDDGIDLASGYLKTQLASLGPIEVFHDECAATAAGFTFGTKGVFSTVDTKLEFFPNGDIGIVSIRGIAMYRYTNGAMRKLPDDGSLLVANWDGSYSLKSQLSPDELVYRSFASTYMLAEVRRTVGATWAPYTYSYFYDRAANGALVQIRQSNSAARIAIESSPDAVRVAEYLPNQTTPARWFTLHRTGDRLARIEQPGPNGSTSVQYTLSSAGRVVRIDYPSGAKTLFVYGADGRVRDRFIYETTGAGDSVSDHTRFTFTGTPDGGFTAAIAKNHEGANETTTHAFDARGLLVRTTIGGIDVLRIGYDELQRVVIEELPAENTVVSYGYYGGTEGIYWAFRNGYLVYYAIQPDATGLRPTHVYVDYLQKRFVYDAFMRPTQLVEHDGSTRTVSYNAVGVASLVETCVTAEPSSEQECTRVDYARAGLVTRVAHGVVSDPDRRVLEIERNANNFVTRTIDRVGSTLAAIRTFAGHDMRGTPAAVTTTDYVMGGAPQTSSFAFYADGSLAAFVTSDGTTERFAYDAAGQLTQYTFDVRGRARADADTQRATTVQIDPSSTCGPPATVNVNGAQTTSTSTGTPQTVQPPNTNDGEPTGGWSPGGGFGGCTYGGGTENLQHCTVTNTEVLQ